MPNFPIPSELIQQIDQLSVTQLAWLSGYCWAQSQQNNPTATQLVPISSQQQKPARKITILSASQTGNARRVAEKLLDTLKASQFDVNLIATGDYKSKNISQEDIVLLVTSTQGEGDPPDEAIPLFKLLFGKKTPDVSRVSYAVLALGDSSYPDFCKAGESFDTQLADLGAKRIATRVDCDLDYQADADRWIDAIHQILLNLVSPADNTAKPAPQAITPQKTAVSQYNKENPFEATLSLRQKITSRDANKDIEHIEIDLSGSNLDYQPGDALGIWLYNDEQLVDDILAACQLKGDEMVKLEDGESMTIRQALIEKDEITQNNPQFVKGFAAFSLHDELLEIANIPDLLQETIHHRPILSLLLEYPTAIFAQTLQNILRPLTPRLYSIASSKLEVEDEVHITVALVSFEYKGRIYTGGASGFLNQRLPEGETLKVFIEPNFKFRLPDNPDTPVIMIGAGTGIAPFRAFMQERENIDAKGKNWLIFGNQKFTDDFLYQVEWQNWHKLGLLNKTSFAWSRQDPTKKVYVQHKLQEEAADIWLWLQQGAHIYVCGDANHMAKDVDKTLFEIIMQQGQLSEEDADEYLTDLREQGRYQRDVY